MAGKVNKIINVKVEGVGKIKQLEESLKKLRKQQRDIKKDMKDGANATKEQTKQYKDSENAIKRQSKALRETKKAMLDANNTTKKSTSLQKSMTMGVIQGAAAFSILVTAFRRVSQALTTLIGTFTEFEFVMAKVRAVSGANEEEFKKLSDSAQELGRSTFFTASEVANLQLNLSKLGFTTDEVLAATEATINLSIATGSDLARSATVAGNAVRGFQLEATETGRVVDVMAVAFTSSALDIEKWQTSMTKVAPIATMAGFSIEETTAIMAKLSVTGIEASIAGTSLRNIFLKMQDPTSELTRKVGHTIHSLDDMLKVFKDMQAEGTDLADVLTFMDVRQVAAFGTMLQGADDIQVLVEELENADGAGQRMADTVGDTLQGGIFRVKSALEGLSIAMVSKFGGALKKTLVKFADWLNKLVNTEGALEKIGAQIKFVIKMLASYVIGVKAAALYSSIAGSAFFTMATKSQQAATMVRALTVTVQGFGKALKATGIGFLIATLAEATISFINFDDSVLKATDDIVQMKENMIPYKKEIEEVKQAEERLIKVRERMSKLLDQEGNLLHDTKINQNLLTEARNKEGRIIKKLNGYLKKYGEEQIDVIDNNEDIAKSLGEVTKAMQTNMLAAVYFQQQEAVLSKGVSVALFIQEIEDTWEDSMGSFDDWRGGKFNEAEVLDSLKKIVDWKGSASDKFIHKTMPWGKTKMTLLDEYLTDMLDRLDISYGDAIAVMGNADWLEDKEKQLKNTITEIGKEIDNTFSFDDLLTSDLLDGDDDDGGPENQNAVNTQQLIMSKHLNKFYAQGIKDEEDYRLGLLNAQKKGLQEYIGQETNVEAKNKANVQLMKLQKQIDDEVYKQLLTSIERERVTKKEAAQLAVLDGTAQRKDLYNVLNKIDEEQNQKVLQATIDAEKDVSAIRSKINQQTITNKQNNFKDSERILTEEYEKNKLTLDERLANDAISEIQHKQYMLLLEQDYLNDKKNLYLQYGEDTAGIVNQLKNNEIESIEAVKEALGGYLSDLGDLGSAMQDLAGDEEKLSGLRKAGVVITQAAATAEKVLAIANTMTALANSKKTLSEVLNIANTPAYIGANAAKTVSNIATAASGFISTISSAAASIPFPLNILAIGATLGVIFGAVKKITSSFGGGKDIGVSSEGGGGSSSSRGGGRSSSGAMSYYTYGGQHSTYADGGMVYGNSHAQGGEKFALGGRVVELEGGEAVINKRSTSMFRSQLSAMNTAGGGVKFADGGVTNNPSFAQTQFDVTNQSSNRGSSRVVVVEADITSTQNTIKTIEAEASF